MVLYNFFSRGRHAGIPHGVVLGVYLPIIYRQCHPEYPIFFIKLNVIHQKGLTYVVLLLNYNNNRYMRKTNKTHVSALLYHSPRESKHYPNADECQRSTPMLHLNPQVSRNRNKGHLSISRTRQYYLSLVHTTSILLLHKTNTLSLHLQAYSWGCPHIRRKTKTTLEETTTTQKRKK